MNCDCRLYLMVCAGDGREGVVPEAYLERCEAGAGAGDRKPSVNSWGEDWDSDEEEHR